MKFTLIGNDFVACYELFREELGIWIEGFPFDFTCNFTVIVNATDSSIFIGMHSFLFCSQRPTLFH